MNYDSQHVTVTIKPALNTNLLGDPSFFPQDSFDPKMSRHTTLKLQDSSGKRRIGTTLLSARDSLALGPWEDTLICSSVLIR